MTTVFLTEEKLKARMEELSVYRYRDAKKIAEWTFRIDEEGEIGAYPPNSISDNTTIRIGDRWEGRDLYVWLSANVPIPKEWDEKQIIGFFDFGNTGGGNNSGFESLLFVNKQPYQGVDSNHKEVFLSSDYAGNTLALDFRLWSGLEGGGHPTNQEYKLRRAEVAWLDESVDGFYFDAKAMIETIQVLNENQPEKHQLLQILNQSINKINWLNPGASSFYESIYHAQTFLTEQLQTLEKSNHVTFQAVGHTHIDVAWLWRLKHTREKSARSFSTVLRLMERYPEYKFLQSQPQLYAYLKEDYPAIYESIKQKIAEGAWEADGGMWLEADCNIPSGESLVRQLLVGRTFFKDELNIESEYLWLPDVFGYSWALPQILKKSGIKTFMTTKISWSQFNRMPHDTFYWRGIDGSEILTHFITTTEPWPDSRYYTYNGFMTPQVIKESWEAYRDKQLNQDLLISYGYGDGGGGVNREMLEMRSRMDKLPGLPRVKTSRAKDYFRKLHETMEETENYVHTWDGELYLEFHRGTYTSQAFMKRMNRKLELLYRDSEWLSTIASVYHDNFSRYPDASLLIGWKAILRNQFHDIIPGSSINEVYKDAKKEYQEAEDIGNNTWNDAVSSIIQSDKNKWTIFNSVPWNRDDTVFIRKSEQIDMNGKWVDSDNKLLTTQVTEEGCYVYVKDVPAMGWKGIAYQSASEARKQAAAPVFNHTEDGIISPFYMVSWNEKGQITRLYDRKNNREVLAIETIGNVLQVFEDKPLMFDAWDIDIFYQEKMEEVSLLQSIHVIETGDLHATIRFVWNYGRSVIQQDMIVYRNHRRIDFKTSVDWQENQRLLKVAFPVDIRSTEATYDIQFGNVKRPTHWNTSWDYARFETVGHQWADLSEEGYGVSLLNDCKYGYDIKDNVIRLSLLKSPIHPDPGADKGYHEFTYALFPHQGNWSEGQTVEAAWALNKPLIYSNGRVNEGDFSMFRCSVNHVMIDAVKKAENSDQAIVRIHEFTGKREEVSLTSDFSILSWQECDLMERVIGEKHHEEQIKFYIKPYEIKTFLVNLTKS